jgi:SAM-dependent methyltransferase
LSLGTIDIPRIFGGARVSRSDVFDVDTTNPNASFIGDLTHSNVLPPAVFDCIVCIQTLELLYDMRAGLATLHCALKPGGVLLLTTPGIRQLSTQWAATEFWSLTAVAMKRLLEEQFKPGNVSVETHGNVFAATAFLYGLAVEEFDHIDLDVNDARYPVIVAARASKANDI